MYEAPREWSIELAAELRVTTPSSIWLIRQDRYCRLPRHAEQPRWAASDALTDGDWHEHVGAWVFIDPIDQLPHVRLLPGGRPAGSRGIHTGAVEAVERQSGAPRVEGAVVSTSRRD